MMNKIEKKFTEIRKFCEQNADPVAAKKYARFFTEGYDAYGLTRQIFEAQRDEWYASWKEELSVDDFLLLGEKLIATGKYEEASFAISFLYLDAGRLYPEIFEKVGNWLENGIANWAHTDVLSGRVLAYFINNKMIEIESLKKWTESGLVWKRRAVPVTLVEALKTDISLDRILSVIEPLMPDDAHKVQQGLGWLLREAWKKYPERIEMFLLKWKDTCGRTIIQYATEKMKKEDRSRFKRVRNKD
jgi:3-methyladenine DNA glycosylase AlkD